MNFADSESRYDYYGTATTMSTRLPMSYSGLQRAGKFQVQVGPDQGQSAFP